MTKDRHRLQPGNVLIPGCGSAYEIRGSQPADPDTVPVYQGMERWQEWVKTGTTTSAV